MNRSHFAPPFSPSNLPPWRCPTCEDGALSRGKETLQVQETPESVKDRKNPDWEPDWIRQRFSLLLRCVRCKEPVIVVGKVELVEDYDEEHGWGLSEAMRPTFFEPAVPAIQIPKKCPVEIGGILREASSLFWSAPPAAGNRIRAAVERFMDDRKIPTTATSSKGKTEQLTLDARIKEFAKVNPELGQNLLAVKWIGNVGSHSDKLTHEDVLDAFELVEHALEETFESKSERLKKLAASINLHKGPAPK